MTQQNKPIISQTPPNNFLDKPRNDFDKNEFEVLIWQKGYEIYHEKAIICPCKTRGGEHRPDCKNCGGTGWLFVEKTKTRMVLQHMNKETKYKEWSELKMGNVSISCSDRDPISFMDRLTLLDSEGIHSQIVYPILENGKLRSFTNYSMKEVINAYAFLNSNTQLQKLKVEEDFTIQNNIISFTSKHHNKTNFSVAIRYKHEISYHVIDTTRDTINSFILDGDGKEENIRLPLAGVGRKAHYILNSNKMSGTYLFDNF